MSLVVAMSKPAPSGSRSLGHAIAVFAAVVAVYAVAFGFRSTFVGLVEVAHGFALGTAAVLLAWLIEARVGRSGLAVLGVATLVGGIVIVLPEDIRRSVWLGVAAGGALAAACTSMASSTQGADRLTAFVLAAVAAACVLGTFREGVDRAATVPVLIAVIGVIALMAVQFGKLSMWIKALIVAAILVGGAKLLAIKFLFLGASFNVALGAVACAAVVTWILENEDSRSHGPFAISALIWLAWSTVAFGLLQGLGIAISAVFAAAFLLGVGSNRGLLSMCILVPLLFYRVFLEMYPTETRQFDVGQQYAVMGIAAGIFIPIAAAAWLSRASTRFSGFARPTVAVIAAAIGVAVLVAADFVLGSHGTVGMLVGLAMAPFVAGISGGEKTGVLAAVGGLAAAVVIIFKFAAPHLLLERAEKIQVLGWSIGIAVVLIALAHWLTKETHGENHESAA
jgi:hypothetical protein